MSLNIRAAEPRDAVQVTEFIGKLAAYEELSHESHATEAMIAAALFAPSPKVFADIAEWDSVPAGFALWFYNFSSFEGGHGIYLEDLFVEPRFRNKGIGKALLRRLAQRCQAEGLTRLQWWVLDWNAPAIALYRSLGAVPMTDWTVMRVSGAALQDLAK